MIIHLQPLFSPFLAHEKGPPLYCLIICGPLSRITLVSSQLIWFSVPPWAPSCMYVSGVERRGGGGGGVGSCCSVLCALPFQLSQVLLPFLSIPFLTLFPSKLILSLPNSKTSSLRMSFPTDTLSVGYQFYVCGIFPNETGRLLKAGTKICQVRSFCSQSTGMRQEFGTIQRRGPLTRSSLLNCKMESPLHSGQSIWVNFINGRANLKENHCQVMRIGGKGYMKTQETFPTIWFQWGPKATQRQISWSPFHLPR